jgi:hypothetical protein
MDQYSICLILDRQWFSALDISGQLIAIFDSDAIAYSIVTKYLKGTQCTVDEEMTTKLYGPDAANQIIMAALDKYQILSVQDLALKMCISPTMV